MREKLNSNPVMQAVVVGFLLIATGFFVMSSMGGGGEEGGEAESGAPSVTTVTAPEAEASAAPAPTSVPPLPPSPASAARLPDAVTEAFAANRTVVLLFVRNGGIDDRMVAAAVRGLRSVPDVASFVVPAGRIARYAAISQGVAIDRVPALVVLRPRNLNQGVPVAYVHYGYQPPESVVQAVIDAGYKGRTLDYHP